MYICMHQSNGFAYVNMTVVWISHLEQIPCTVCMYNVTSFGNYLTINSRSKCCYIHDNISFCSHRAIDYSLSLSCYVLVCCLELA